LQENQYVLSSRLKLLQVISSSRKCPGRLFQTQAYSCSFSHAKRSFYRSFDAIFGTVGRTAPEKVIIELMKKKCLPILYYALEVCPLNKAHIGCLYFAVGSCFSKIFCVNQVKQLQCLQLFNCQVCSARLREKTAQFYTEIFCM